MLWKSTHRNSSKIVPTSLFSDQQPSTKIPSILIQCNRMSSTFKIFSNGYAVNNRMAIAWKAFFFEIVLQFALNKQKLSIQKYTNNWLKTKIVDWSKSGDGEGKWKTTHLSVNRFDLTKKKICNHWMTWSNFFSSIEYRCKISRNDGINNIFIYLFKVIYQFFSSFVHCVFLYIVLCVYMSVCVY